MPGDDWKPTVPERPSSRDPKAARDESDRAPSIPSQRYVGGEEIARGGMGRVIEATDTLLARTVAVKEALTNDPDTLRRFARETRITARLEHPSIVPVYDAGTDPSAPFYVMRRVSGRPLSGLIAAATSLDERLALIPHVLACAQAIAHAHKRGVIHRDIKPGNILVGELGETVVIDWGIAKVIGESDEDNDLPPMAGDSLRTRIGTVSGTPGFMSPEQARGDEIGTSADVWALGATLYYLLSRQMPHEVNAKTADDLLALAAYRHVPPLASVVAGVPPDLAAITERALAFEAADRFPDAASLAEELARFLTGQIVASHRYSVRERLVRWINKNRAIVAVALLAITVVAVVSTIAIRRVVAARERADASAQLAEVARAKEQAHAESELLARARAIATTHPTAAIAAIDLLPASSPLAGEANAIFATAISHGGAAWGLAQNTGLILALEIDPSATKLLQLSSTALLQIWDLDRRTLLVEQTLGERQYVAWLARGVLVYGRGTTSIIDPATKQMTPFGSVLLTSVAISEDGTRMAAIDDSGNTGWIDVGTGQMTRVADHAKSITMPRDGSWIAVITDDEVVVYDPAGAVILRRATQRSWVSASRSKHIALLEDGHVFEATVVPGAVWEARADVGILWPEYFDETLVGRSPSTLYVYGETSKKPFMIRKIAGLSANMSHAGSGMLSFTSGGNSSQLFYFDLVHALTIPLPEALATARLATGRGSTRVVVASNAIVLVLDLRYTLPKKRADIHGQKAEIVSDQDVMSLEQGIWFVRRADRSAKLDSIIPHADLIDTYRGRVLFTDRPLQPETLFVFNLSRLQVWSAAAQFGRLVDDGVVYIAGTELFVRADKDTEGHKVADLRDANVTIATEKDQFFAFSGGELVRGSVAAGVIERKPFRLPESGALLVMGGRLLLADGKTLRWDSIDGPVAATIEDGIVGMYTAPGGAVGRLASGSALYLAIGPDGTITTHRLSSVTMTATGETGRIFAPSPEGTEVIELPSRQRWVHPIQNTLINGLSVSPSGTTLLEYGADTTWWEWTLPPPEVASEAIRHSATNAREQDDRALVWPWQTR